MYQAPVLGPMPPIPMPVQNGPVSKLIPINWMCQKDGKFCSHQTPIQWISGLP
uniref:Uncharacterized protein n=1 Tax=Acrobeloides nanus TaxID=290746 RepID=A0A914DST6_9BILA